MTIPMKYRADAIEAGKESLGRGFVDEYYLQIAGDWAWLYYAGIADGKSEQRLKQKASVMARRRNKGVKA